MLFKKDEQEFYRKGKGDAYVAPNKGWFLGSCNRSACQAPNMATWWNQSTHSYYCYECARLINEDTPPEEARKLGYENDTCCIPVGIRSRNHPAIRSGYHPGEIEIDFDLMTVNAARAALITEALRCDDLGMLSDVCISLFKKDADPDAEYKGGFMAHWVWFRLKPDLSAIKEEEYTEQTIEFDHNPEEEISHDRPTT